MMAGIKIAIPLFRNRLSARFEYATEMMILEACGGEILSTRNIGFDKGMNLADRMSEISRSGVSILVCCRPSPCVCRSLMEFGIAKAEVPLLQTEIEDIHDFAREFARDIFSYKICNN